ncbi:hypothetical protein DICVIV_09028 [Dictyocaulus viviparus]|uniref:KATNIP domain-containing protein n=1 Tax=Dictyocaulus viviparus TaxID=29172 RepID=A0A0D8XMH5_DICVI|nr:hypothetical protein DICVIV_09028 [Dictyocaulus viviparus]
MNGLVDEDDLQFEIPELPCGRTLCLELLSNWGDSKYIGLNAVEIFSDTGKRSEITKISTDASRSIGDVESIFVESFSCTDRSEMWRAEFEPNRCVRIEIEFVGRTRIAMIRFWNYSESRVHAQMGVRRLRAILDGFSIFDGEIDCAFTDHESEPMGETILFTTDESILESIAENDGCFEKSQEKNDYSRDITGDELALELTPDRPITREVNQLNSIKEKPTNITAPKVDDHKSIGKVKVLQLELCENWGAPGLIGLTGLELLDHNHDIIDPSTVTISSSNETQSDPKKLLNGNNLSRLADDMWLTSFDPKNPLTIIILFDKPTVVKAISFWNYNSSPEMAYAGVRLLNICFNGKPVANSVLLRKAPGFVLFDFVQDVRITCPPTVRTLIRPATKSIYGFIFQLRLLSTWGDEFYIGLNGIELYDRWDRKINVGPHNLAAFPESINILPSVEGDPRACLNLINGCNDTNR